MELDTAWWVRGCIEAVAAVAVGVLAVVADSDKADSTTCVQRHSSTGDDSLTGGRPSHVACAAVA